MDPVNAFNTSVPKADTYPSGVFNSSGILLTKLSTSTGAVAIPWYEFSCSMLIFCTTPGVSIPPISSPLITVPVVFGYLPLLVSNIARTLGAYPRVLAKTSSPPILSACGKDMTQPIPIAPLLMRSTCIEAKVLLGIGHPPSLVTSCSSIFNITKLPDGSCLETKASKIFNLSISVGVDWNTNGSDSIISIGNKSLFINHFEW